MSERVLTAIGVLLVVALTNQMTTATARSTRKPARAPHPAVHQLRDAFGSAPGAAGSKSCDIYWCYEN
jgi:hypothetical protein